MLLLKNLALIYITLIRSIIKFIRFLFLIMNLLLKKEKINAYRSNSEDKEENIFGFNNAPFFVLRGIKNFGNTCYIGSILQCFNSFDDVLKEIVTHKYENLNIYKSAENKFMILYCDLVYNGFNIFSNCKDSEFDMYLDKFFNEYFKTNFFNKRFKKHLQHDAYEFLLKFFEFIDMWVVEVESIKRGIDLNDISKYINNDLSNSHNIVKKNFELKMIRTLKCRKQHSKSDIQYMLSYELPINESCHQLIDCVDLFFAKEYIEDLVECEECGKRTQFESQYFISEQSDNLNIVLKRFEVI